MIALKVNEFKGGWAIPLFGCEKVHYFMTHPLTDKYVKSRCGMIYSIKGMCESINYGKCKRCIKGGVDE